MNGLFLSNTLEPSTGTNDSLLALLTESAESTDLAFHPAILGQALVSSHVAPCYHAESGGKVLTPFYILARTTESLSAWRKSPNLLRPANSFT